MKRSTVAKLAVSCDGRGDFRGERFAGPVFPGARNKSWRENAHGQQAEPAVSGPRQPKLGRGAKLGRGSAAAEAGGARSWVFGRGAELVRRRSWALGGGPKLGAWRCRRPKRAAGEAGAGGGRVRQGAERAHLAELVERRRRAKLVERRRVKLGDGGRVRQGAERAHLAELLAEAGEAAGCRYTGAVSEARAAPGDTGVVLEVGRKDGRSWAGTVWAQRIELFLRARSWR